MARLTAVGLAALLAADLAAGVEVQQPLRSQAQLVQLRAEKLAKPVFQRAPWLRDYDAARAKSKAEEKLLFVYFTRSYAG